MSNAPKAVLPSVNGWNADYLDSMYAAYQADPHSVEAELRQFFQGFDLAHATLNGAAPSAAAGPSSDGSKARGGAAAGVQDRLQAAVTDLVREYRASGHLCAAIDPFGRERPMPDQLDPLTHGLPPSAMNQTFDATALTDAPDRLTLREMIQVLDETYCGSIGVEIAHISSRQEREWLTARVEKNRNRAALSRKEKAHLLFQLHRAELYEKFCAVRYPGVKRFSLEGCESLIPMLDRLVEHAGDKHNVEEIIFGMAHRGRLNVLANVIGKTYEQIFTEFDDAWHDDADAHGMPGQANSAASAPCGGDVKYHRGYSAARLLPSGKSVWLVMASNPSHLESVNAVVLGRCRAKQVLGGDVESTRCIPVLIHGDAAVIAQGVVAETLNMSLLDGYKVGGAVHIVINNLIGFTTGEEDARSSRYCTDFAKGIEAPVFHVNGEDPEAVLHAVEIAMDYRMAFKKDVFIDLIGYRLHGHNETDEAAFTQPLLYKLIKGKPSVLTEYAAKMQKEGVISGEDAEAIRLSLNGNLDNAYDKVKKTPMNPVTPPGHDDWSGITSAFTFTPVETGVGKETLHEIAQAMGRVPEGFHLHDKLGRVFDARAACIKDNLPLDWGIAEGLAFGSLLLEKVPVRLSGQDVRRGTFSHRHDAVRDVMTNELYVPLNHIREPVNGDGDGEAMPRQSDLSVFDSPLSEFSVVGFEYGYSLSSPNMLTLWEGQFGDFANGAQTIIDQYIAAGEAKWRRWSGLVLLLPHGYEGQGPEHSSCRLERFLLLCADQNIQVVNCSTPAQYFHVLRRQVRRDFRKPLIVATPKSLLRLPEAASRVSDLATGSFREVLDDPTFATAGAGGAPKAGVKRVILCSGKVYYDLVKRRTQVGRTDLAIVRVEQLYPLHTDLLKETLASYPKSANIVWVQEEPKNAGAWQHMFVTLNESWGWELAYIGRPASSTPATGSHHAHDDELDAFLTDAVGPRKPSASAEPALAHA